MKRTKATSDAIAALRKAIDRDHPEYSSLWWELHRKLNEIIPHIM